MEEAGLAPEIDLRGLEDEGDPPDIALPFDARDDEGESGWKEVAPQQKRPLDGVMGKARELSGLIRRGARDHDVDGAAV